MMDEVKCNGCNKETDNCRCQELVVGFNKTNQYLYDMDLLDRLAGFTLTNLIQERIDTHVQDTCKGILDTSHVDGLLQVNQTYSIAMNRSIPKAYFVSVAGQRCDKLANSYL